MFNKDLLNKFQELETPFYYYDIDVLNNNLDNLSKHLFGRGKVHYALKANSNVKLLNVIKSKGIGVDAVSSNEIKHALDVGFSPKDIVFAGVGKTDKEIEYSIKNNISYFNCESIEEIDVINSISKNLNNITQVSIRINPGIKTGTHKNIETGYRNNKFGIDLNDINDLLDSFKTYSNLNLVGFHFHIGSQIETTAPFLELCKIGNQVNKLFIEKGLKVKFINVGGGLSIDYTNPLENNFSNFKDYFKIFSQNLKINEDQEIHFELGRSIVGQCGFLVSKVLFNKKSYNKNFLIIDAGMNDLIRPALYGSCHKIINISSTDKNNKIYDIVGPICESTDIFAKNYDLKLTKRNDILLICSAGAYGESMSSNYNLRKSLSSYFSDTI